VLWLALYLPALPLQAYSRSIVESAPVVVFEREAARTRVVARNSLASKQGIDKHMPLSTAHALCNTLIALPRESLREAALLERLANLATKITPNIHVQQGFGLLLEISASLKLFGGSEALLAKIQYLTGQESVRTHAVIAPTASGARWLARGHRQLIVEHDIDAWLDDLAFDCTDFSSELIDEWHALNLHHLAALRSLPKAAIARRFGAEIISLIARAYGQAHESLPYWQPLAEFNEYVEFLDLARESTHWMPGVEALLKQLQVFLRSRAAAVQHIELNFQLGSLRQTCIALDAAHPTHHAKNWLRLIHAKLERQPVAHEVSRIDLYAQNITPLAFADTDLFERHRETDRDWKSLLHLLKLRMGSDALKALRTHGNALPESRAASPFKNRSQSATPYSDGDLRPHWLIDPPRMLSSREVRSFITSIHLQQPERIQESWSQPDGANTTQRDYYIARTPDYRALWVYRERPRNDWYLQGIFA
jgi:protein ImuB